MEKYESDETLIARWVAGELNDDELSAFKKTEAYKEFNRINEVAQNFKAPPVDSEQALIKVKEQITFGKRRKIGKSWYAIAASIALVIGLFGMLNATKSYTTAYGEQLAVVLPDGSEVQLNAGSQLTHKRFFWLNNKTVHLEGEGFFSVEKGDGFAVETAYGKISVLGTKFNIKTRQHTFALDCFEGVVQFDQTDQDEHQILRENDRIVISNQDVIVEKSFENQPNWMKGISVFKEAPLQEVIDELERQYDVKFQFNNTDLNRLFTGSFLHDDLDTALRTTLKPMGIKYIFSKDKKVIHLP